jgi:DNA modification methylase
VDAVVTDPPYGIGRDGKPFSTSSHGGHKGYEFLGWDATRPNEQAFRHIVSATNEAVIWGGNYFADLLPPCRGWLVWDKGQRIDQADAELAWTSLNIPVRVQTLNRVAIASDGAVHPTQKPVALMVWCIGFVDGETILDPFMGSGTTGVACIRTGRRFIGVEISETYCKIAAQRMERELSQPFLPTLQPAANAETPLLPSM